MEVTAWLKSAQEDADRRGLAELKPLLEALSRATAALRDHHRTTVATERASAPRDTGKQERR